MHAMQAKPCGRFGHQELRDEGGGGNGDGGEVKGGCGGAIAAGRGCGVTILMD